MITALRVGAAVLGRRRAGVSERPIEVVLEPEPTLRALISAVVTSEVDAFGTRQAERAFIPILTEQSLSDGVERGAVRTGGAQGTRPVDTAGAISAALVAFEDGMYQVYVDDELVESLDQRVELRRDSRLIFLRLVALAGG